MGGLVEFKVPKIPGLKGKAKMVLTHYLSIT